MKPSKRPEEWALEFGQRTIDAISDPRRTIEDVQTYARLAGSFGRIALDQKPEDATMSPLEADACSACEALVVAIGFLQRIIETVEQPRRLRCARCRILMKPGPAFWQTPRPLCARCEARLRSDPAMMDDTLNG